MDSVDYLMVFALSFGTGLGTTLGAEVARSLIRVFQERMRRKENVS